MNDNDLKLLQRLGEDTAYTFKGLHKEADWLDLKYKLYLSFPIVFSIVSLGFDQELPSIFLKIFAVISLVFTVFALLEQSKFEKSASYRQLADKIKIIYDRSEECFYRKNDGEYENLRSQWEVLREVMSEHPISSIARFQSKKKIRSEMELSWLGGEYS